MPPTISTQSSLLSPSTSQYTTPPTRSPRLPSPNQGSNLSNITLSTDPSFRTAQTSSPPPSSTTSSTLTKKDFSYLLRPEIYHPLTHLDIPPPFRSLASQPTPTTPLSILLSQGHFRSAAIKAANLLTTPGSISPFDHTQIFSLVYTRLSCLTLCNQTALAAQEVKALEDLNSAFYRDTETDEHLVPWELRVLAVRLQGMGFNDVRRGVMGYYDLAKEARLVLSLLKKLMISESTEETKEDIRVWETRLADLSIRVASALIEMEDFDGAARFLSTLTPPENSSSSLNTQKALLYLCLGQVDAARSCISNETETGKEVILALALMADADYASAVIAWEELIDSGGDDDDNAAMYKQNLAVALLYLGKMAEVYSPCPLYSAIKTTDNPQARQTLESLISDAQSFHALTFNLSTIYELCTERSRALKISLAEKVAGMLEEEFERAGDQENVKGWEKVNGDFKL